MLLVKHRPIRSSVPTTITPPPPPPPPPPPASAPGDRIQFSELKANNVYAHFELYAPWVHAGGDYRDTSGNQNGINHYKTGVVSANGQVSFDIKTLVDALRAGQYTNTGIYIHATSGQIQCWSRTGATPPKIDIQTSSGPYTLFPIADCFLDSSSNSTGNADYLQLPMCLKFDFGSLAGTLQTAVLRLQVFFVQGTPTVCVNKLDMPLIIDDPKNQGYTQVAGLAGELANETALAASSDVLVYQDFASLAALQNTFYVNPAFNYISLGAGGHSFVADSQLGVTFLRTYSRSDTDIVTENDPAGQPYGGNSTVLRLDRWFQPTDSLSGPSGASWKRTFTQGDVDKWTGATPYSEPVDNTAANGFDEMWMRYVMEVGTDVHIGFNELGMKLFTTNGRYEWGAFTPGIAQLDEDQRFEYMLWHSGPAADNPGVYRLAAYCYDAPGHTFQDFPSNGDIRVTEGYLREGRKYTLEQYVKLNTIVAGVPQSNGIHRIWLDGCLVYQDTTRKIRQFTNVQIQGTQAQVYHGGQGKPSAKFHYDVGAMAVSVTRYIGPPKSQLPSYVPAPGKFREVGLNTPFEAIPPNFANYNDCERCLENYTGGCLVQDYSTAGGVCFHGGGEHGGGATDSCSVLVYNIGTRSFEWRCNAPKTYHMSTGELTDSDPTDLWAFHVDAADTPAPGAPSAGHTYNWNCEARASWGLGTQGAMVQGGGCNGGSTQRAINGDDQPSASNAYNCVTVFDLAQTTRGYSKLTPSSGSLDYGIAGNTTGINYGGATEDYIRQGWFGKAGFNTASSIAFVSKTGVVTYSNVKTSLQFPCIRHVSFGGQDVLFMFYIFDQTNYLLLVNLAQGGTPYTMPPANWQHVSRSVSGTYPCQANGSGYCYVADSGPRWSYVTNDRFYCMDHFRNVPTIFSLIPSNPADLMNSTWRWENEIVTTEDGSNIIPNGPLTTDGASRTGIFGKLIEIPAHRSLCWVRTAGNKMQYIRPTWLA